MGFSPLNTDWMRKIEYEIYQTNKSQQQAIFNPNPFITLGDNELAHILFLFCIPMTLNQGQGHIDRQQNAAFSSIYHHHAKFEPNWFVNVRMYVNAEFFLQSVKQLPFPWSNNSLKITLLMFSLNCFMAISSFISFCWKVSKKVKPTGIAFCWPCDPNQVFAMQDRRWSTAGQPAQLNWLHRSICYKYGSKTARGDPDHDDLLRHCLTRCFLLFCT